MACAKSSKFINFFVRRRRRRTGLAGRLANRRGQFVSAQLFQLPWILSYLISPQFNTQPARPVPRGRGPKWSQANKSRARTK